MFIFWIYQVRFEGRKTAKSAIESPSKSPGRGKSPARPSPACDEKTVSVIRAGRTIVIVDHPVVAERDNASVGLQPHAEKTRVRIAIRRDRIRRHLNDSVCAERRIERAVLIEPHQERGLCKGCAVVIFVARFADENDFAVGLNRHIGKFAVCSPARSGIAGSDDNAGLGSESARTNIYDGSRNLIA